MYDFWWASELVGKAAYVLGSVQSAEVLSPGLSCSLLNDEALASGPGLDTVLSHLQIPCQLCLLHPAICFFWTLAAWLYIRNFPFSQSNLDTKDIHPVGSHASSGGTYPCLAGGSECLGILWVSSYSVTFHDYQLLCSLLLVCWFHFASACFK